MTGKDWKSKEIWRLERYEIINTKKIWFGGDWIGKEKKKDKMWKKDRRNVYLCEKDWKNRRILKSQERKWFGKDWKDRGKKTKRKLIWKTEKLKIKKSEKLVWRRRGKEWETQRKK